MKLFSNLNKELNNFKDKLSNYYQKIDYQQLQLLKRKSKSYRNIDNQKDLLRSSLKFSTYAPLIIQSYLWLYGIYAFYTILKTIVLIPIEICITFFNIYFKQMQIYKSNYITIASWIILTVTSIFLLNQDIFDISFMYHLIRGQSTVKVYAIIFALESFQIVLTKVGTFLNTNIQDKLTKKDLAIYKLIPQFIISCIYVFLHTYSIFIQFLIYCVVLSSSMESFVIFWSVIYLTKMKNSPAFTVDSNKYKQTLTIDSKYRVNRMTFLFLFLITQIQVQIPSLGLKEVFIIMKHMLYLLSNYTGSNDMLAIKIREEMYKCMYLDQTKSSIQKCVAQNFTVLPAVVFCIKTIFMIINSSWQLSFMAVFTYYIIVLLLMLFYAFLINLIKFVENLAHQKSSYSNDNAFINSLCIALLQKVQQKVQNIDEAQKNIQNNIKQSGSQKSNSILQALLFQINLNKKQQNQNKQKLN